MLHCDLKSENILVSGDLVCKLADFGLSLLKDVDSIDLDGEIMGTLLYMSPECLRGEHYDERSDIYSLGVVAFEICTRIYPAYTGSLMSDLDQREFTLAILQGTRPEFPWNAGLSRAMRDLISSMWHDDEEQRPDITTISSTLNNVI
jgi:serine/threonine protein kinase